jgi:hypothetical protein
MSRLTLLVFSIVICHGGAITGFGPVTGSGTGALVSVSTTIINNDNPVGPSPNTFEFTLTVTGFGSISHPITVLFTNGVTEYQVLGHITNNTSLPIIGWNFQLPGSPYDFDYPDFDGFAGSSLSWLVTSHTDSSLNFLGGTPLMPGQSMSFAMDIDAPDCSPGTNCGFSSTPFFDTSTPEPGSAVLLGLGLLALLIRRHGSSAPAK